MGCAGCGKKRKANPHIYLDCPICGTVLHGPKKDMPEVNGTKICGLCFKKYKKLKELEKAKPKKVKKDE